MTDLFERFGKQSMKSIPGPMGNMENMMQKFNQFRSAFSGDPKQQVEQLLKSGKMTQEQYNQCAQFAQMFSNMIH